MWVLILVALYSDVQRIILQCSSISKIWCHTCSSTDPIVGIATDIRATTTDTFTIFVGQGGGGGNGASITATVGVVEHLHSQLQVLVFTQIQDAHT